MKKVVFGITSLTLGGAERVLVDIANRLSSKYEITIFTIYANGELEHQLNSNIKLVSIYNTSRKSLNSIQKALISFKLFFNKHSIYGKYLKDKFDTEIAFLEGPITRLFSVKNEKVCKIAWVHNDISQVFGTNFKAKLKRILDGKVYTKYKKIVLVSNENLENFKSAYPFINSNNLQVIYNYINPQIVKEKSNYPIDSCFDNNTFNIITVARLVPQKALDRLIRIHSKLIEDGVLHNIYVIGEGPEESKLECLIKDLHVENSFSLLGKIENPYPYIKQSDALALLSYFEGYGMVIEEAKILGKYIIVTDTAAREAIFEYPNSKIVDNTETAIYEGLKELINNGKMKDVNLNYNNEQYIEKIINLIEGEIV